MTEDERAALKAKARDAISAIPAVMAWADTIPKGQGAEATIDCPVCKGALYVAKVSSNGHLRTKCATDGCVEFLT